jgi:acetyl esterase/lipase
LKTNTGETNPEGIDPEGTDPEGTDPNQEESEQEDPNEENPNIQYVKNGHRKQTLDLYLPPLSGRQIELTPVVIYIRYDSCMLDNPRPLRDFVQSIGGYALAFVDYRDDDLPAAVYDCKAAIRWLRAHAGHYKLDPDCFIAWGKCDAGLLAAILGTTAHLRVFDVGYHLDTSSAVQGVMA